MLLHEMKSIMNTYDLYSIHESINTKKSEISSKYTYIPESTARIMGNRNTPHVGYAVLDDVRNAVHNLEQLLQIANEKSSNTSTVEPACPVKSDVYSNAYQSNGKPQSSLKSEKNEGILGNKSAAAVVLSLHDILVQDQDPMANPYYPPSDAEVQAQTAHAMLNELSTLYYALEQLLVLRFQNVGGVSYFETKLDSYTSGRNEETEFPQDYASPAVKFRVGQVLRHKKFGYRGVCTGWDVRPSIDTSRWEGVRDLELGKEQPFYRVLPDVGDVAEFLGDGNERESFYVAQENLAPLDPKESCSINNKMLWTYFKRLDVDSGTYVCREKLQFCFPTSDSHLGSDDHSRAIRQEYKECEDVTVRMFSVFQSAFIRCHQESSKIRSSSISSRCRKGNTRDVPQLKLEHLLLLLKTASNRSEANVIENLLWVAWMCSENVDASRRMREAVALLSRGNSDQAFELFRKAADDDDTLTEAYIKLASICALRQEHASAVRYARKALKYQPKHYGAHAISGMALMAMKGRTRNIDAMKAFQQSIDCNPWSGLISTKLVRLASEEGYVADSPRSSNRAAGKRNSSSGKVEHANLCEETREHD
eukprot:CAMPEP_0185037784 /NCGR_PEP_ID=MMETSP1103-20130426/32644_1 /TAXON_ID=36769 /ORGANISM="Paraphysomonas bandaiensis, Strain Caron Lab Isolate" /LENGTH=592 /DNA_ID=CAMNT_0027575915 /DNA_START=479 /DNA_END=2257 /DNA_ORIENTATION=-